MIVQAQQPSRIPCRIALVGEAPGEEEERHGVPFIGKSGRVINGALAAAGIDRAELFVGNVFLEKAEENNVTPWMRDPERLAAARDRLGRELGAVQPTVIVPLGATALEAIAGVSEISRLRGSPFLSPGPVAAGVKLLPTFHPAFVLRQWKLLPVLIGDLIRASVEADRGPGIVWPWREFTLEPDLPDVRRWMTGTHADGVREWLADSRGEMFPSMLSSDLLSVDIETGWGEITCIGLAPDAEHAICIPFVDMRKPNKSYWATAEEEIEAWRLLRTVLESDVPKLGQNFTYDAMWLLRQRGIRVRNYRHDTRLMHHALFPELPKDLAFMAASYTGKQWKQWGRRGDKRDE